MIALSLIYRSPKELISHKAHSWKDKTEMKIEETNRVNPLYTGASHFVYSHFVYCLYSYFVYSISEGNSHFIYIIFFPYNDQDLDQKFSDTLYMMNIDHLNTD